MKSKIVSQKEAVSRCAKIRKKGGKIVFTNGCFDILHSGHAVYLQKARKLGGFLIVGLNTDESMRRLKGASRPIVQFKDRALLLAHLESVDLVVGFTDDTPLNLIKKIKPDILAKGADYKISEIVGASEVRQYGGSVKHISLVRGKSTSGLLKKLKNL